MIFTPRLLTLKNHISGGIGIHDLNYGAVAISGLVANFEQFPFVHEGTVSKLDKFSVETAGTADTHVGARKSGSGSNRDGKRKRTDGSKGRFQLEAEHIPPHS
ncbi:hypothetical protein ABT026_13120 [Streptomyces sp. NPDC002734]|uniref:hypothetical protein n=1 Tax=Streptomyces sp. NPDC002734 TaxID=3154426 RepID=UPI003326E550